uniref:NADH-ubiquinone oxidoreductase chain 5 n=1 Tax=Epitonium scalare TaxID=494602 RepID=A0A6B9MID7_9CAEN|nr:NADH dehydrogenase subunit 5 [Epitonium scalare]
MFKKMKLSSLSSLFLFLYSISIFPIVIYFMMNEKFILLDWHIVNVSSCSMSMMVILDSVSLSFSNVVCLISACVMLFSSSYMAGDKFISRFTWIVLLFVLSMNLLIFIPSLPALLLGWDGLGIVSFALVVYYQNSKSLGAGFLTLLANRVGDVMILISIGLLVLQGHWVVVLMWNFAFNGCVVMMLVVAGMTKSAQIPFSAWLPAAMAAPTPVSALVHSSTLVTAGVYLVIRFHPFLSEFKNFNFYLLFISVLTLLMAGIGATFENDLKKIIALSTLSQLGVMMLSLSLNMVGLSLFHLYTHALFKALLFLCAGAVIHNSLNNQDLRYMGMISSQMPFTITCMNVANFSLCGAPFLSGFYSKDLILQISLMSPLSFFMILLIFIATGFTLAYSWRLMFFSLWSPYMGVSMHMKHESDVYVNVSTSVLAVLAIISGMFLQMFFVSFEISCVMIPESIKYFFMGLVVSGLVIGYMMCQENHLSKSVSKLQTFFGSMWFLFYLSAQPLTKFSMVMSSYLLKSVEFGWMEVFGGGGSLKLLSNLSQFNQSIQMKSFNLLVGMMFFTSLTLIVVSL